MQGRVVGLSGCKVNNHTVAHVARLTNVRGELFHDFRIDEDLVAPTAIISKFVPDKLERAYDTKGAEVDQLPPFVFEKLPPVLPIREFPHEQRSPNRGLLSYDQCGNILTVKIHY